MIETPSLKQTLRDQGFAVLHDVVPSEMLDSILPVFEAADHPAAIERRGSVHAIRNLLEAVPEVQALARSPQVRALVDAVLGPDAFAARGLLFDKTPAANWKVAWHQDLTIAVRERRDAPGFGPWSEKAGILHVQPPASVLERMVTYRLGAPRPMRGGERPRAGPPRLPPLGRLSGSEVDRWRTRCAPALCTTGRGGVLLMSPLILHASSPASAPGHRRVVHLQFATGELPDGLEWHGRW